MNSNICTLRHIKIKWLKVKDKERILNATEEKPLVPYKRASIRLSTDFSSETSETRRQWANIFKILKGGGGNTCQPRILYPAILSFRNEGEIKKFPDKQKLRESLTTRSAL